MQIRKIYIMAALLTLPFMVMMCSKPATFEDSEYDIRLSGGAATAFDETSKAFGHMMDGMNANDQHAHELGDHAVEQTFVTAPAPINSGLGPIFNNVSCVSCHHNDGKGNPTTGLVSSSMLVRLSMPGTDEHGGPLPVPGFGLQLQDVAIFGKQPEAKVGTTYTDQPFTYPDGTIVTLRKPWYTILNPYIPLPAGVFMSARMAPPFFGLGLLQNIPESTVLGFADEGDADGDGISGRPNYTWDPVNKKMMLGRFGMKANTATILTQVAAAYQQDMGITSTVFPQESSFGQPPADGLKDDPELPDSILNATAFYIQSLAVPARRSVTDPQVQQGEKLFAQTGCTSCHKPTVQTGVDVRFKQLSNQRIHPYTDLLLHDLGPDLGDGRQDYTANGNEWKTPALWGIGLFEKTNGTPFYLHDGRARTLEEAILWHGGEALKSRQQFASLSKTERDALVRFLKSI
ncbi:MAG TPA: di-heme oxidoredictase family protein [Chitinophaga sp.]|uniref:di-heme oxidoreductase family protein n=1 Tax=Chitinophaga sp. TaxID=1869181 RepID=UPI002F92DF6E